MWRLLIQTVASLALTASSALAAAALPLVDPNPQPLNDFPNVADLEITDPGCWGICHPDFPDCHWFMQVGCNT
ncbi:MAG: hypothetical protein WAS54_08290 [Scrofimicrobium sp.]